MKCQWRPGKTFLRFGVRTEERDLSAENTLDLESESPWWVASRKGSGPEADSGQTERAEGTTGSVCGCFIEFVPVE